MSKPGKNSPCPCKSGKKYKKCCMVKDSDIEKELAANDAGKPTNTFRDNLETKAKKLWDGVPDEELLDRDSEALLFFLRTRKKMLAADQAHMADGIANSQKLLDELGPLEVCEGREAMVADTEKQIELLGQTRDKSVMQRPEAMTLAILERWYASVNQKPHLDFTDTGGDPDELDTELSPQEIAAQKASADGGEEFSKELPETDN